MIYRAPVYWVWRSCSAGSTLKPQTWASIGGLGAHAFLLYFIYIYLFISKIQDRQWFWRSYQERQSARNHCAI